MLENVKVVYASVVGVAVAAVAVIQGIPRPIAPEGFWPVTFIGWLTAVGVIVSLMASGYALHRFSQKGVIAAIKQLEAESEKALKGTREHYDGEIQDLRNHYDEQLRQMQRLNELQLNRFTEAVEGRMNGFGQRVERHEDEMGAMLTVTNGLATGLAESRVDRQHLHQMMSDTRQQLAQGIASISTQLSDDRRARESFERELLRSIRTA